MSEKLIHIEGTGHAFITKAVDNECPKGGEHDELAAVLTYRTRRGEGRYINQDKYLILGTTLPRKEHRRMNVVGGSVACSKCGCPYVVSHNPHYL